jgi:hypothetical protein
VLADVARVAGIPWGTQNILAVAELARRLQLILTGAQRYAAQLPDACLDRAAAHRPRSYAGLVFTFSISPNAFSSTTKASA